MKKIMLLTCVLMLCVVASAYAVEYTYSGVCDPIIIDQSGEHTVILNDVTSMSMTIQSRETKVIIVLKDGTTNTFSAIYSLEGDSEIAIRCESAGKGHKCTDNCGKLVMRYAGWMAAIGGAEEVDFTGSITIAGGAILIEEGGWGACIGSGYEADMSGSITISGGSVTIEEGGRGAGIGSGHGGAMSGSITISDGSVTSDGYGGLGAIIGSGECGEMSGTVTITDSSVTVQWLNGAGVGSGLCGKMSGTITITDSTVTMDNEGGGAGVGSGRDGEMSGTITIANSTVTGDSGSGAGIGSGENGKVNGAVTIEDSTIDIKHNGWGAGIGSGAYGELDGIITIIDSTVSALGEVLDEGGAAGIGAGESGDFTGKLIMRGDVDITATGRYWGIGPGHGGSISEGAEIYVEPVNRMIGVKQGANEEIAVTLEGTPYSVKTDLIPLLNGSSYVRTRYNPAPIISAPGTPAPAPAVPDVPQTGDGTNFALLAALAVIGMIGVTVILRRKNEA